MHVIDLINEEYHARFVVEGSYQKEGFDYVEYFSLVSIGFKGHGWDTHGLLLKTFMYWSMNALEYCYFRINDFLFKLGFSKFSSIFNSLFDRYYTLKFDIYVDDFIF